MHMNWDRAIKTYNICNLPKWMCKSLPKDNKKQKKKELRIKVYKDMKRWKNDLGDKTPKDNPKCLSWQTCSVSESQNVTSIITGYQCVYVEHQSG